MLLLVESWEPAHILKFFINSAKTSAMPTRLAMMITVSIREQSLPADDRRIDSIPPHGEGGGGLTLLRCDVYWLIGEVMV